MEKLLHYVLTKPLEPGKKYSFSLTYAADGKDSEDGFAPLIYTYSEPNFSQFTRSTHCLKHKRMGYNDTTLCRGESIHLHAPSGNTFNYLWNTGNQSDSIDAYEPGKYSVTGEILYNCQEKDSINLIDTDCEVRMTMPNVFTPNSEGLNELFKPINYNYVVQGYLQVFNRWGNKLLEGDLFAGWNGTHEGSNGPTGPYYYTISYSDPRNKKHHIKGIVTIAH